MSNLRSRETFTLTDVIMMLFVGALPAGGTLTVTARSREPAYRIKCAVNLRQIGQAIIIYANENKGVFPRTVFDATANPSPAEYTNPAARNPFNANGPGPNDVKAPLFLLLRAGDLGSEVFRCPVGPSEVSPWPGDPQTASNFSSRASLTYGYANPYPTQAAVALGFKFDNTLSSDFALAADMGPGPVVAQVASNAPRAQLSRANSPNHNFDGQNVLYADCHVDWVERHSLACHVRRDPRACATTFTPSVPTRPPAPRVPARTGLLRTPRTV